MKLLLVTDRFTVIQHQAIRNLLLSASKDIVFVSDAFYPHSRNIQFIILDSRNGQLTAKDSALIEKADLAVSVWVSSDEKFTWKIVKDRKKNVTRDVSGAEFFFTLGKYHAFDLDEALRQQEEIQ